MILIVLIFICVQVNPLLTEYLSSIPCEYQFDNTLICRQTSLIHSNLPLTNETIYSNIINLEWIESGAYVFSTNIIDLFSNLKNLSLQSNALTSVSALSFWSYLRNISHLDLSQNRLISLNNRDFQLFHNLISLNISLNFLTTIEPIWLLMPIQFIDLSNNGINVIGNQNLQNSTPDFPACLLKHIYINHNRGLLSFSQFQTTIMDYCPLVERFQLFDNHWHCACTDLVHSLKHYRTLRLIDDQTQTLTGRCETPLSLRHIDIQKLTEEFVCERLLLFDSILNDEATETTSSSSLNFSRQVIFLFLIGCVIGFLIGLCLHYCTHRCYDFICFILYKCDRDKIGNDRTSNESITMNETNLSRNHFIYYPAIETDQLPSYSQVMNDIFYLDIITQQQQQQQQQQRQESEIDENGGEC